MDSEDSGREELPITGTLDLQPLEMDACASAKSPWLTRPLGVMLLVSALAHALALMVWWSRPPAPVPPEEDSRVLRLTLQAQAPISPFEMEPETPVDSPEIEQPDENPSLAQAVPATPAPSEPRPSIDFSSLDVRDYYVAPERGAEVSDSTVFDPRMRQRIAESRQRHSHLSASASTHSAPASGVLGNEIADFGNGRCLYHNENGQYVSRVFSRTLCPDPISEGEQMLDNVQKSLRNR